MNVFCPMAWAICKKENGTWHAPFISATEANEYGPRYVNMDYIFFSSLAGTELEHITVCYDIACQWCRHLLERMEKLPAKLHLPKTLKLRYRVPKFHLPAHVQKCWAPYSFNFSPCVGRTDGEGVERSWSTLNGVARCVSMMGQGGRMDTLDDFCNDHNWMKTINAGTCPVTAPDNCLAVCRRPLAAQIDLGYPRGCGAPPRPIRVL